MGGEEFVDEEIINVYNLTNPSQRFLIFLPRRVGFEKSCRVTPFTSKSYVKPLFFLLFVGISLCRSRIGICPGSGASYSERVKPNGRMGMMDETRLRQLQKDYARGDLKALSNLWSHYSGRLQSLACIFAGGNHQIAEEGLADLRLQLVMIATSYDPDRSRWMTFAELCLRQRIIDIFRKQKNTYCLSIEIYRALDQIRVRADGPGSEFVQMSADEIESMEPLIGRVFNSLGDFKTEMACCLPRPIAKGLNKRIVELARTPRIAKPIDEGVMGATAKPDARVESLRECLEEFSQNDQKLLYQYYYLNLTLADMAKINGQSLSSISRRLARLRELLAEKLRERKYNADDTDAL